MPANVQEDLSDGLRITEEGGVKQLTRIFFCTDLSGSSPIEILYSPYLLIASEGTHTGGDIPERGERITIGGEDFWCISRSIEPWGTNDATVTCVYSTQSQPEPGGSGYSPTITEVGTTLEQDQTNFDATNLALAYASRTPITIPPPAAFAGQPSQNPTVPIFVSKATIVVSRTQTVSPEADADRFVGKKNNGTWHGYAAGTVLCLSIIGRNSGGSAWDATYSFARDPTGKFDQVGRWVDPNTGLPSAVTAADVAAGTGIKLIVVQGEDDFSAMGV